MKRRLGFVLALSVCLAACGTRESGPPPGGEGAAATTPTTVPRTVMVGTLEPGCGNDRPAHGATDRGVTDTTITIGVISDQSGVVAVPTAGIDGSVDAFVEFCNSLGGINGRKLVLKHYDSKILNEGEAMKQACDDDIFALVGSGSVQDDQGAVTMVQCGLVEVAAYTATYIKGLSPRVFAPVPNPGTEYAIGPGKFVAKQFPDAVKKAAILWPNLPVGAHASGASARCLRARRRIQLRVRESDRRARAELGSDRQQSAGQGRRVDHRCHDVDGDGEPPAGDERRRMEADGRRSRSAVLRRQPSGKAGHGRRVGAHEHGPVRGGGPQPGVAAVSAVVEEGFAAHAADDARRAGLLGGSALRASGQCVGFPA